MTKRLFKYSILSILSLVLSAAPVFSEEKKNAEPPPYSLSFEDMVSKISRSKSGEDTIKIVENSLLECKFNEDYEKFALEIKNLIQKQGSKNIDAMSYAVAKIRVEQLSYLSKQNDIESGRLFMSLNAQYYNESLEYLDMAAKTTTSKELLLDIYFLKLLIAKEKFLYEKTSGMLTEIMNTILQYSDDSNLNKVQLIRISTKFNEIGLKDYAIKLKVSYASKIGTEGAKEIFEDIRKSADQYFAQGNMKEAIYLYEQYIKDAKAYFAKDEMAANIMDIAEKYFASGRYKEARKYYEFYMQDYSDSKVVDYSSFRIALCYYYEKDYTKAISRLESFIREYQNSIWYDKAYEVLAKLYYENFPRDKAIDGLQKLIDKYYRKNTGDYAQVLVGLLYYGAKDYDSAAASLKKVDANSFSFYAAETLMNDIKAINGGAGPSFGCESADTYKIWQPYKPIMAEISPVEAKDDLLGRMGMQKAKIFSITKAGDGTTKLTVDRNAKILFRLEGLEDQDKFGEYLQDKDDLSRLPKKIKEESEKDLLLLQWATEGGKFSDEKQTKDKTWEAPEGSGTYNISVRVDDFGLVRSPDKGLRKDPAKELKLLIVVEG